MKRTLITAGATLATVLSPMVAFAANAQTILDEISRLIGLATPIVVALALLYFFWGLANYILNSGDDKKKDEGKRIMIWGIIALFVMVSVWGIVNVIQDTFNKPFRISLRKEGHRANSLTYGIKPQASWTWLK